MPGPDATSKHATGDGARRLRLQSPTTCARVCRGSQCLTWRVGQNMPLHSRHLPAHGTVPEIVHLGDVHALEDAGTDDATRAAIVAFCRALCQIWWADETAPVRCVGGGLTP